MDTELLKTFLEVGRTRHFGQAADNLYISQSAVSARVRLLEEMVGVPLFTRARNNIQLTAQGQKLVRHAERILNSWNRARQDILLKEDAQVPLAVGGVPSLWDIVLQDWLHWGYRNLHSVSLSAEAYSQEMLLRQLLEGSLDLVFLFDSPQLSKVLTREIARVPLVMVASRPGLSAAQAVAEQYILVDWGTSFAIAHARHFPDMAPPALRAGLGRIARSVLLEYGGAAYLARPMVEKQLAARQLFVVEDAPEIDRAAYAVYPADSEKQQTVAKSLEYFDKP